MAMQKQTYYDYDDVGDEAKPHSRGRVEPDQYIQLYDEAMKRVDRHQNIYSMWIDSECTFKPDTAKTRHKYKNSKSRYRKSFVSEKPLIEKFNSENFDETTGQPFFHPKVGRSPARKNHRTSKSIGNLLYDNTKVYKERKQKLADSYKREIEEQVNYSQLIWVINVIPYIDQQKALQEIIRSIAWENETKTVC